MQPRTTLLTLVRPHNLSRHSGENIRLLLQQLLSALLAFTALLHTLEEGRLGGAVLDVFEREKAPLEDHVVSLCR